MEKQYYLGIDISTSATGVALMKYNNGDTPDLLFKTAITPKHKSIVTLKNGEIKTKETKAFPTTFLKIIAFKNTFNDLLGQLIKDYGLTDQNTMFIVEANQLASTSVSHIKVLMTLAQINFTLRETIVNLGFSENSIYNYTATSWQCSLLDKNRVVREAKANGEKPPTTKQLSIAHVEKVYNYTPKTDDESDAVCLALAYQNHKMFNYQAITLEPGLETYKHLKAFLKKEYKTLDMKMTFKLNDSWQNRTLSMNELKGLFVSENEQIKIHTLKSVYVFDNYIAINHI